MHNCIITNKLQIWKQFWLAIDECSLLYNVSEVIFSATLDKFDDEYLCTNQESLSISKEKLVV